MWEDPIPGMSNLNIPREREKAKLKAAILKDRVTIAETKQRVEANKAQLAALKTEDQPKKRK